MAAYIELVLTESNVSIENNTSVVTANLYYYGNGVSYNGYSSGSDAPIGQIIIDGTAFAAFSHGFTTSTGAQWMGSASKTVTHNADGSRSVSASATFNTKVSLGTLSCSKNLTLTMIPRASCPTVSVSVFHAGSDLTIQTNRVSGSFTHTLRYSLNGKPGTIATDIGDSFTWKDSKTKELANLITNAPSGVMTIYCDTKNGSTHIGTKTINVTVKVPASDDFLPKVSMTKEDTSACFSKYGKYVQGKSKLKVKITAQGAYGASIVSKSMNFDGRSHTVGSDDTVIINNIKGTGLLPVAVTVKDSRGNSVTASEDIEVLEYAPPKITYFLVRRTNENGVASSSGEYLSAIFTTKITALDNKNSAKYILSYKKAGETSYTEVPLEELEDVYEVTKKTATFAADASASYDIKLKVIDDFSTIEKAGVGSSIEVLWSREAKGRGFAFGKVAEYISSLGKRLEVAWNTQFEKSVTVDGLLRGNGYSAFTKGYGSGGLTTSEGYLALTLAEVGDGKQTFIKSENQTGVLKVVLPMDFCGSMVKFDVEIFSYNRQALCTYSFGGQIYKNNTTGEYSWSYRSYNVRGSANSGNLANLPIAFGRHNGKAAISIGATDTVWGHCLIVIRNVEVFYAYVNSNNWNDEWEIICNLASLDEVLNSHTSPADRAITSMGIADWIVEQGTINGWTYEKWNSGKALCYKSFYEGSATQGLRALRLTLPFEQVDANYLVFMTPTRNGSALTKYGVYNSAGNKEQTTTDFCYAYTTDSNYCPEFNFEVRGRWK